MSQGRLQPHSGRHAIDEKDRRWRDSKPGVDCRFGGTSRPLRVLDKQRRSHCDDAFGGQGLPEIRDSVQLYAGASAYAVRRWLFEAVLLCRELEMFAKLSASQPIGRMGKAEEVEYLALFLCSDQGSFLTGVDYPLDGGFFNLRG
jgi:hypothetical protein